MKREEKVLFANHTLSLAASQQYSYHQMSTKKSQEIKFSFWIISLFLIYLYQDLVKQISQAA